MGNKRISDYTNSTSLASTTEFLTEKSDGAYEAVTFSVLSAMLEIGREKIAYNEDEADAIELTGKYLAMADAANPSNAYYTVTASSYPLLAAARPEWVDGSNINIPNLYNRVLRHYGNDTGDAGTLQEDAMQGHRHGSPWWQAPGANQLFSDNDDFGDESVSGTNKVVGVSSGDYGSRYRPFTTDPKTGGHGTVVSATETRVKSFIVKYYVRALI